MDATGFRSALDVVQEVMSVGKELRKSVTRFLRGLNVRDWRRRAARSRDTEDGGTRGVRRKDDGAVWVPRARMTKDALSESAEARPAGSPFSKTAFVWTIRSLAGCHKIARAAT